MERPKTMNNYIPKISVVIPVYNTQKYLRQCLDSVLTQPLKDLEVVCVNDGSTDDSPQILEEYAKKDNRICVIHQQNLRLGIARNNGISVATGEYIHFLDSDDYLTENAYEESYKIANKNNLDWLITKAHPIDAETELLIDGAVADRYAQSVMRQEDYEKPFTFIEASDRLTTAPVYPQWCGLYKHEFLMESGIRFHSFYGAEDHAFYYDVATRAQRIMVADIYLVNYRMNNSNSLSGKYFKHFNFLLDSFSLISNSYCFLPEKQYAQILNAELNSLFSWYRAAMRCNENVKYIQQLMVDFVRTFDISPVKEICCNSLWYSDYLILKFITLKSDNNHSKEYEEKFIEELLSTYQKFIPIPLKQIKQGSSVVLYGAGFIGWKLFTLFETTNICDVVLWVDKNWKVLSAKGFPVHDHREITQVKYDYVCVGVENPITASEICTTLSNYGVPVNKVISINNNLDGIQNKLGGISNVE